MAVNANDRVSTRRLKQFYGKLKLELAQMFKDAKPNYLMPNENDQIGVGYGYHRIFKNRIPLNNVTTLNDLETKFSGFDNGTVNNHTPGQTYPAGTSIVRGLQWIRQSGFPNVSGNYGNFFYAQRFMTLFAGKMVWLPAELIAEEDFDFNAWEETVSNYKSEYGELYIDTYDKCWLTSPIYTLREHTYQTRIQYTRGPYLTIKFQYKVDDGDFVDKTVTANDYLCYIFSYDDILATIGACDVPNDSITSNKLQSNSVTANKISNNSIASTKLDIQLLKWIPMSQSKSIGLQSDPNAHTYYSIYFIYNGYISNKNIIPRGLWHYSNMNPPTALTDENNNIIGFEITASLYSSSSSWATFQTSGSFLKSPLIGDMYLETNDGKYHTQIKMVPSETETGKYIIYYLDDTFAQHLTETFVEYTAYIPFSPMSQT